MFEMVSVREIILDFRPAQKFKVW